MHQIRGLYMHDKYAASWIHASYTRMSGSPLVRGPPKLLVENITVDFEIYWPFGSGVPLRPSWHEDVAEGCPEVTYTLSLDENKAFDITANVSIENYASLISLRAHLMMIKMTVTVVMVKKTGGGWLEKDIESMCKSKVIQFIMLCHEICFQSKNDNFEQNKK